MIELHPPILDKNEFKTVNSCLKSGWLSSSGNYVRKFERGLSNFIKTKNIFCCSNGTSALHISLKVSGVKPNEEVIVPSITYVSTINVVLYEKAKPIFMDCDDQLNIDVKKTLDFLKFHTHSFKNNTYNKKTKKRIHAIIITHVFGNPVQLKELITLCKKKNIFVIEDAAESLGSYIIKNKKKIHTGLEGDFGCLSFNVNKIITCGGGGAIIFKKRYFSKKIKLLINQYKNDPIFFRHDDIGYNYGLLNINSAIGYAQLKKIKNILSKKERIHRIYLECFKKSKKFQVLNSAKNTKPNNWLNVIILKKKISDIKFKRNIILLNKKGIQVRPVWKPNHLQLYLKNYEKYKIKNIKKIYNRVICLPSGWNLKSTEINRVYNLIDKIF